MLPAAVTQHLPLPVYSQCVSHLLLILTFTRHTLRDAKTKLEVVHLCQDVFLPRQTF